MYKADINQLNSLLDSVEWHEALKDLDINSAWTYFSSKFNTFLKESIPILVQKERKICIFTRKARTKEIVCGKDTQDHNLTLTTYLTLKLTMLRELLLITSIINLRQIANSIKENPLNYARNKMKTYPVIGSIESIDGKLYTSNKDKSNALT